MLERPREDVMGMIRLWDEGVFLNAVVTLELVCGRDWESHFFNGGSDVLSNVLTRDKNIEVRGLGVPWSYGGLIVSRMC